MIENKDRTVHKGAVSSAPYLYERKKAPLVFNVDKQETLRYLGYAGQTLSQDLISRLDAMALLCKEKTRASYIWRVVQIDDKNSVWEDSENGQNNSSPKVALKQFPLVLPGKSITSHLRGAKYLVLLGATLGLANERELRTLSSINSLDAILFSSCSNALIEQVANVAQIEINEWAKNQGLYAKMRFSPGYGDLPLDIQPAFLASLNAQKTIGLNVSDTNLLIPTKSITAIIGLFDHKPDSIYIPCRECASFEFCAYREKGLICHA